MYDHNGDVFDFYTIFIRSSLSIYFYICSCIPRPVPMPLERHGKIPSFYWGRTHCWAGNKMIRLYWLPSFYPVDKQIHAISFRQNACGCKVKTLRPIPAFSMTCTSGNTSQIYAISLRRALFSSAPYQYAIRQLPAETDFSAWHNYCRSRTNARLFSYARRACTLYSIEDHLLYDFSGSNILRNILTLICYLFPSW